MTHGINMKPMNKVREPQSIIDTEIPKSNDAKPEGDICVGAARFRLDSASDPPGERSKT